MQSNNQIDTSSPKATDAFMISIGFVKEVPHEQYYTYVYYFCDVPMLTIKCWGNSIPAQYTQKYTVQLLVTCTHENTLKIIKERQDSVLNPLWKKE